jgi:hypothetical protein
VEPALHHSYSLACWEHDPLVHFCVLHHNCCVHSLGCLLSTATPGIQSTQNYKTTKALMCKENVVLWAGNKWELNNLHICVETGFTNVISRASCTMHHLKPPPAWCRIIVKQFTGICVIKKCASFVESQGSVLWMPSTWVCLEQSESTPYLHGLVSKTHLNIIICCKK